MRVGMDVILPLVQHLHVLTCQFKTSKQIDSDAGGNLNLEDGNLNLNPIVLKTAQQAKPVFP